jgi:hypothetical protein
MNGFITGENPGIYRTRDGGTSWSNVNIPVPADKLWSVCFSAATGLACGSDGIMLKSTDGGTTWRETGDPEFYKATLRKVVYAGENTWYTIGNLWMLNSNVMFFGRSSDDGESWEVRTYDFFNYDFFTSVYFTGINTGYIAGTGFIMKTTDGGVNWIDQTPSYQPTGIFDIGFADQQTGCAVGYYGQIVRTTNGGGIGMAEPGRPDNKILGQVYPNPAIHSFRIPFTIRQKSHITIEILDLNGHVKALVANADFEPGAYRLPFTAERLSPGLYLCRLRSDSLTEYCKLVIQP